MLYNYTEPNQVDVTLKVDTHRAYDQLSYLVDPTPIPHHHVETFLYRFLFPDTDSNICPLGIGQY